MSNWRERLPALIAVPIGFGLLTYETQTGFQILEPKDIPSQIPIVRSPLHRFFYETLVNHLLKYGAKIEKIQRVHIFRKSNGFVSNDYFTLTVQDQWSLATMIEDDFRPALINQVEETNAVFFSRDYYNRVLSETDFVFQELTIFALLPLK